MRTIPLPKGTTMFNLNTARIIIGSTMIYGSIAAATLKTLHYSYLLDLEKQEHKKTQERCEAKYHTLRATIEELRMQNQMLNTALDILTPEK